MPMMVPRCGPTSGRVEGFRTFSGTSAQVLHPSDSPIVLAKASCAPHKPHRLPRPARQIPNWSAAPSPVTRPAVRAIMQANNRRLYRLARGILRNDGEAEDVVQETYVRAFTHLEEFRGDLSLSRPGCRASP